MKKRWRDKTRQSQPACSDRSGEPISPHRSGEGAPSAAAPDREGGDEWRQPCTRRSCLPTSGSSEQTSVGPKRRRKKGKRRLSDPVTLQCAIPGGALAGEESAVVPEQQQQRRASNPSIKISYGNSLACFQEPGKPSSFPPAGKETIKQNDDVILKKGSLDDAELSLDQPRLHASHSSSQSVGAEKEETSVGPKARRKKGKQRLSDPVTVQCAIPGGVLDDALVAEESAVVPEEQQQHHKAPSPSIKITYSSSLADLQEPGKPSSFPPAGKETIKHNDDVILKNVSLDDAELPMDQSRLHASHSSSRSVGAEKEETSVGPKARRKKGKRCLSDTVTMQCAIPGGVLDDAFDEDRTSSGLKVEKELNPSSGDPGKIAPDEDEDEYRNSINKPSSVDLSETIAQDDDEQHSDNIHVHPIKEHRQEQEWSGGHIQNLLDIDSDTMRKMLLHSFDQLNYDPPEDPYSWSEDKQEHFAQLDQRLAFYRIRSYELSLDSELAKLDHEDLVQQYPMHVLRDNGYFEHYERSLEWYIDPQSYLQVGLEDYHRLVLRSNGEYQDWDWYRSILNSYEKDLAYVKYCEAMENETKWIEDYLIDRTIPWKRVEDVAYFQALNIASRFPNVSRGLVSSAFKDHIWSVHFDFFTYKGVDVVFFEIWKRVTKRKMGFTEAWSEVYREKKFPLHIFEIEQKVNCYLIDGWTMKDKYDACVAGIGDSVPDDEALQLITEAVRKMARKPKTYVDYARKKLEIAKEIGLIRNGEGQRPQEANLLM